MHAGAFITEARSRAGLSVEELAERSGESAHDIDAWELGHVDVPWRVLEKLVRACGQRLVTRLEEDDGIDWTLYHEYRALTPQERLRRMTKMANFILKGQRAIAEAKRAARD